MSITEIIELVGLIITGLGLLGSIVAYVLRIVKDVKTKKLQKLIEQYMAEAEKSPACTSGATKLMYVLKSLYNDYGKDYEKIEDSAKAYIEECIDFSKKVNAKGGK
jgi:hypothetical protein